MHARFVRANRHSLRPRARRAMAAWDVSSDSASGAADWDVSSDSASEAPEARSPAAAPRKSRSRSRSRSRSTTPKPTALAPGPTAARTTALPGCEYWQRPLLDAAQECLGELKVSEKPMTYELFCAGMGTEFFAFQASLRGVGVRHGGLGFSGDTALLMGHAGRPSLPNALLQVSHVSFGRFLRFRRSLRTLVSGQMDTST